MSETGIIPYQDIERMGGALAKSGLFGIKTQEQAVALMLVAQAQGLHPASVAMEYDVIQGRPALKGSASLARFKKAGGKVEWLERTDAKVSGRFTAGDGSSITVTWDMARAKAMQLTGKDNWQKQPMIMLQWRVVAEAIRAIAPEVLGGSYLSEEVVDFEPKPEMKNITPQVSRPAPPQTRPEAPRRAEQIPTKDELERSFAKAESLASLVLEADSAPSDPIVTNPELFDEVPASEVVKADDYMAIGPIQGVDKKTGSSKRGPWTLVKIKVGDAEYGTFDKKHHEMIDYAKAEGLKVKLEWKTTEKGSREITDLEVL